MKRKLAIACAVLLAAAAAPAWSLQLGQIQVKSALNQPLVAAIPLHPENLTELEGLTVALAPADDFARAGLQVTAADRSLQFHIVTDNNGQKLILVTSSEPITDPYLDFLVQVNTRKGKQVREFVVLLNPVIAAPAPEVLGAPVTSAPVQPAPTRQPAELPPPPQPVVAASPMPAASVPQPSQPQPQAAPRAQPVAAPTAPVAQAGGSIPVAHGDTLYAIAKAHTDGSRGGINRMMLALKAANPEAFFKDNINDLKAGAILRIPGRDEIDRVDIAEANAEVHRQYEAWRAARPQPATVVEGTAAEAAARAAAAPGQAGPPSDHLALVPPTVEGGGAANRPGVAGGTASDTVAGLTQQLQNDRGTLVSIEQSNADLESRVRSLKEIADKSGKLLSLKDGTIAELQQKLATVQAGAPAGVAPNAPVATPAASAPASAIVAKASPKPVARPAPSAAPAWYQRPLSWIVAGVVVLILILLGVLRRMRGGKNPLPDPADIAPPNSESVADAAVHEPAAEAAAGQPPPQAEAHADPYGMSALHLPAEPAPKPAPPTTFALEPPAGTQRHDSAVAVPPQPAPAVHAATTVDADPAFTDDPVDTKLDLARAYLDMGDPVGARAMLEEVLEEGSQTQQDEARKLLAEATG